MTWTTEHALKRCRENVKIFGECKGRIFGGWLRCEHGARGRLAEVEKERAELIEAIEELSG